MPFSERGIDPSQIELMRSAFRMVTDRLQLECRVQEGLLTDLIVETIIFLVVSGETDPAHLCDKTLQRLKDSRTP
jgi:hypothetical protein